MLLPLYIYTTYTFLHQKLAFSLSRVTQYMLLTEAYERNAAINWPNSCVNLYVHPKHAILNTAIAGYHKFNLSNPTGYVMHQQFNIQQLYALPTLYLCVLYLSENKQRLVPLTA